MKSAMSPAEAVFTWNKDVSVHTEHFTNKIRLVKSFTECWCISGNWFRCRRIFQSC